VNAAAAVRKMTELRLIELASQLRVCPSGVVLACQCWMVFADYCSGHDSLEYVFEVLAAAETFLASPGLEVAA
jgi:hypothetical protein